MSCPVAQTFAEKGRTLPVRGQADIIIVGAGPAGYAAALGASRSGADVLLLEQAGCTGGIWTSGLLPWIIDQHSRGSIMVELRDFILNRAGGRLTGTTLGVDPEPLKLYWKAPCARPACASATTPATGGRPGGQPGGITESRRGAKPGSAAVCRLQRRWRPGAGRLRL